MQNELDPIPGNWYAHQDKGQPFFVIDIDSGSHLIEIQHFDGDLEAVEASEWASMDLALSAEPENCMGALDDPVADDLGYTSTEMRGPDWTEETDEYHDRRENWEIDSEPGGPEN